MEMQMSSGVPILVTGGAGYIGSHVVLQLVQAGEKVIVLDDLSSGFADAVIGAELVVGNVGDVPAVTQLLRTRGIDTVLHFAARTIVPESVVDPLRYYANNTCATRNLLECCTRNSVKHIVFSSTAAVYGVPADGHAREDTPTAPINPYGTSKLMSEWMLRDLAAAGGPHYAALRYFNVAGCDLQGRIGQSTRNATLLVKVACEAALGKRPHVAIFGTDYATPDGTGVRDYIHVEDLASAHLDALAYLRSGGDSTTLNCGYGHGYSVREVLAAVGKAYGAPVPAVEHPRRAGDPPALVAHAQRIRQTLGWQPRHDDLDLIARTALAWERKLPAPAPAGQGA
jgi:UDP-glucose 4-epimerase